jgi:methylmalonyl-CoA mutase N-terminal domain/subunit
MNKYRKWLDEYRRVAKRAERFETMSGLEVAPVYSSRGPLNITAPPETNELDPEEELPGIFPYTRGIHASGYRTKLWTMRMFAGFSTARETNERFKKLLAEGGTGLSVAFDLPTLMGRDSDDPKSAGEVGKCGVAIDSLKDMEALFEGIDLASVTTSMTINAPAAFILACFIALADRKGISRYNLAGTLQNDILKEYQAQKEYYFPPLPSLRLVRDTVAFTAKEMPKWHPISVSGYHIREAGATAVEELAFTLANGFAYIELMGEAGMDVDQVAPQLSFFFNAHIDFFEEIAKYRAARRIWARWMRERYGALDPRSHKLKFHTQTAGVSLTAQQPEVNIVRTAIEALAGVLGGTQSLHTNSMDEVLSLPTDKAARIALRTQQVLAYETGVTNVVDPLGGSYFVEDLTDRVEEEAEQIFAEISEMGEGSMLRGVLAGIDSGYFVDRIAESAYQLERKLDLKERILVGVNDFVSDYEPIPILVIGEEVEIEQKNRLSELRRNRDPKAFDDAIAQLVKTASDPSANLMPALIDAAKAYATVGEVMEALASVFGYYEEPGI